MPATAGYAQSGLSDRDKSGRESIDADDGQPQRNGCKGREDQHGETAARKRRVEALLHGADVVEREAGIDLVKLLLDCAGERSGIATK